MAQKQNECVEAILDELTRHGLKGTVVHRSKHMEVYWLHEGAKRNVFTSATTSDFRAQMNVRSTTRRMLRADNVPVLKEKSAWKKVIQPAPNKIETNDARIMRIENEVGVLVDMMFELHERLSNINIDVTFGNPPTEEVKRQTKKIPEIFKCVDKTWTPLGVICSRYGRDQNATTTALGYHKRKGSIEHKGGRSGLWRRTIDLPQEPEQTAHNSIESAS